ncbi:MAG: sigma-70 family RNA polymerase sigma factor [Actinomycetota bacterium]
MARLRQRIPAPAAAGEQAELPHALDALFDAWFTRIHQFCLSRTASPTRAEDAASETFADAARMFADGRGDEVTEAWLFTVARRRVIDQWRSSERHRRRLGRVIASTPSMPTGPSAPIEFDEDEAVRAALASLPERQRAAVVLRYVEEYSVSEVAEALDVGYEAAESLLARGRRGFVEAHRKARTP